MERRNLSQRLAAVRSSTLIVAAGFAILMFLFSFGLDWLLLREHESTTLTIELSDALAGIISGVLVFRLLQFGRERRARVEERLQTIVEMNHHIRNAMQIISYSMHSSQDRKALAGINDALDRIQWALREILPKVEPTFSPSGVNKPLLGEIPAPDSLPPTEPEPRFNDEHR